MATSLPAASAARPQRPLGANGFKYKPRFGLIVACDDEAHQQRLHARLKKLGLQLKVVCV